MSESETAERPMRVVIVGGGSAGWMTGAALGRSLGPGHRILVIEDVRADGDSGVLAPFESTLPALRAFNAMLGLGEDGLMASASATFKLGTRFTDWSRRGSRYIHPFSDFGGVLEGVAFHHYWLKLRLAGQVEPFEDFSLAAVAAKQGRFARPSDDPRSVTSTMSYGLHLDVAAYIVAVRGAAERTGVGRVQGRVATMERRVPAGDIEALVMEDGRRIEADLFIDCSGQAATLIGVLETGWSDWSAWLPCNRLRTSIASGVDPMPLTEAQAIRTGWRWQVPLRDHVGVAEITSGNARAQVTDRATDVRFGNGRRNRAWVGNCVAIGLSAACLEPLEGTGLHLVQSGISKLLTLFPHIGAMALEAREYNRLMADEVERIRDLLILHYRANRRFGEPMWDQLRKTPPPEALAHKIRMFESRGRISLYDEETFEDPSWIAAFLGQRIQPRRYHPLADQFPIDEVRRRLQRMREIIHAAAASMPLHRDSLPVTVLSRKAS